MKSTLKKSLWKPGGVLFIIILAAALLRLYGLGRLSLWSDEVLTVSLSSEDLGNVAPAVQNAEQTPPLLHFIMHFWLDAAGLSEFAVRLPAALFGVGSVIGMYHLASRLLGRSEALFAAALLAVSPFHVAYSQEARGYTLLTLLAILSTHALVAIIQGSGWKPVATYGALTGAMYWTHVYGGFVVMAHALTILLAVIHAPTGRGKLFGRWALGVGIGVALFAPWIPTVLTWGRNVTQGFWIPPLTWNGFQDAVVLYAGSWPLLVVLGALAIWGSANLSGRWQGALIFGLIALPVVALVVLSIAVKPVFVPRYGIVTTTGLCLMCARGLAALPAKWWKCGVLTAVVAMSIWAIPAVRRTVFDKPDTRQAVGQLIQQVRPGDVIFLNAGYGNLSLMHELRNTDRTKYFITESLAEVPDAAHVPPGVRCFEASLPRFPRIDAKAPRVALQSSLHWQQSAGIAISADGVEIRRFVRP